MTDPTSDRAARLAHIQGQIIANEVSEAEFRARLDRAVLSIELAKPGPDPTGVEGEDDDDGYADLVPGARVDHPKYGAGTVVGPWEFGQVLVKYDDGREIYSNPDRLSTDDEEGPPAPKD